MRMLFTAIPYSGHIQPLLPVARAAWEAGHTVAFACSASFTAMVEHEGFAAFPAGYDMRGRSPRELFAGGRDLPSDERSHWYWSHMFIEVLAAAMTPDLLILSGEWAPDLIVRDAAEHGGCVAAEVIGIPHASVRTSAEPSSYTLRHVIADPVDTLRMRHGLPPDPEVSMPFRYLHLAAEPPDFLRPGERRPPSAHLLRPVMSEPVGDGLPAWVADLPDRPTIYATLGTVFNNAPDGRATFTAILDALRDEPITLILTVGKDNDPAQFGPQPPNIHIERYIPQSLLLSQCDLVVDQGGFNTVTGALAAGLPQVCIPLGADQHINAECCTSLGAGLVLGTEQRTSEAIRAAVREGLAVPTYRQSAERVRDAMAALPGPEYAAELLERLATEKRAILAP